MRWSSREYAFISGWTPPHERIHKGHGHSAWARSGGTVARMVRKRGGGSIPLRNNSHKDCYLRCSLHCVSLGDRAP